ncbi:MAG: hypothetical protein ABID04_02385 [Patescibacteria group bacterium]
MSKTKKIFHGVILLGVVVLIGIAGVAKLKFRFTNDKIIFPHQLLSEYEIVSAQTAKLNSQGNDEVLVVGLVAKDRSAGLRDYLAIYQQKEDGVFKLSYRYSPVAPKELDYPAPLTLEKSWILNSGKDDFMIVSSWAEVGADYFGSHPVAIGFENGIFKTIPLYQGDLADRVEIKDSSWTQKDFEVSNYFDANDKVKTILTQGVAVDFGKVELSFFADSNCHACEHQIVKLTL